MKFENKFISYTFENNKIYKIINIFGFKIKHEYSDYLYNEKLCSKLGIKTLLFLRNDGIGDFIMDIPYIKHIRHSRKFNNYKIILAGNQNIIEIAKKYLNEYIDAYYHIDNKEPQKNLIKKYKKMSFTTIINPTDAKINYDMEIIVKYATAKEKICHNGYFSRIQLKSKDPLIPEVFNNYTKVIDTGEDIMPVKDRCKIFFEKLLEENIPHTETLKELDIPDNYIVISPFTREPKRTYSKQNFTKIIDYINTELKLPVIIIGGKNEIEAGKSIRDNCKVPEMVFNLVGKTSLSETILYIRNAKLLVANETGTVHIVQNYGVKTIAITNGSYIGTFWPYKEEESYVSYIYPENFEDCFDEKNIKGALIDYDINKIDYTKVTSKISEIIDNCNLLK